MAFRFDRGRAMKPVKVSWRLSAATVAALDEMATEEGVRPEQIAEQALDHVLAGRGRKRAAPGEGGGG